MNTAKEIVCYLETSLDEAYAKYNHWKDIAHSEAAKYRIKANVLEDVLDDIDPNGELDNPEENIAKILVSKPEEKKPKKRFLAIYLNIFSFVVFLSSCIAVWLFISGLLDRLGITGFVSSLLLYGCELLHVGSFVLMLTKSHLLIKLEKDT